MATIKVSENYSRAKSGKPPVGNFKPGREMAKNPTVQRHFPASTAASSAAPKPRHHVASKAVKAGLKATPQGRAASTALKGKKAVPRKSFKGSSIAGKLPKSDKRTTDFIGKAYNHSPVLVAEFVGGIAIISVSMFTRTASEKYQDVMTSVLARFTAFTAVYFILFLMSAGSKRASQAAAWFGLLIDLGLLFDATNHHMFEDLSGMINGTGISNTVLLSASGNKPQEFFATSDIKETSQQAGVSQSPAQPGTASTSSTPATPATGSGSTPPKTDTTKWDVATRNGFYQLVLDSQAFAWAGKNPAWTVAGPFTGKAAAVKWATQNGLKLPPPPTGGVNL